MGSVSGDAVPTASYRSSDQGGLLHDFARDEGSARRATANRVALEAGGTTLTYAALEARAHRVAHRLQAMGVTRGTLVGVCLDRDEALLPSLLGILLAGGAYVPLDPAYPRERLGFMVRDSALGTLITDVRHAPLFDLPRGRQLLVDADAARLDEGSTAPLRADLRSATPADPAYVIYTSGSTGEPKGVVVPHRAVANFLRGIVAALGLEASDRILAVTTISFDIHVLELWAALSVGATVVLASRDATIDGHALCSMVADRSITCLQATPSTWRLLHAAGLHAPRLRAFCGGETLSGHLAASLLPHVAELWNLYGPTETTVWSTCARIIDAEAPITVGKPLPNQTVFVLDADDRPLGPGSTGEICIGGDGVATGYLDRPDLTRARFVPDPFAQHAHGRLYRTGDLGRWTQAGDLEHLGRMDSQIKLRGFRIEPGEIEAALAQRAEVSAALVLARQIGIDDVRLIAYVTPAAGSRIDESDLREHLGTRLPEFMLPRHLFVVDAFPLLPNGKVDRSALPAPVATVPESEDEPRTPTQKRLAALWMRLLSLDHVSLRDNFLELGGSSLLAMQAISAMEQELDKTLNPRLYLFDSLAQIADAYDEAPAMPARRGLLGRLFHGKGRRP